MMDLARDCRLIFRFWRASSSLRSRSAKMSRWRPASRSAGVTWGYTRDAAIRPNRGQPHERETVGAESSKTPSQAALAPYGSDRVNRIRRNGTCRQPPGDVVLGFSLDGFIRTPCLEVYSTPAARVRACASLPLTSPETTP